MEGGNVKHFQQHCVASSHLGNEGLWHLSFHKQSFHIHHLPKLPFRQQLLLLDDGHKWVPLFAVRGA